MADTIINTPDRTQDSAAGWAIAAVVVVAIIIGAVLLFRNGLPGVPNTGTDINVTIPSQNSGTDTGAGSGSGGGGTDTEI
jgi:hypothetical protein